MPHTHKHHTHTQTLFSTVHTTQNTNNAHTEKHCAHVSNIHIPHKKYTTPHTERKTTHLIHIQHNTETLHTWKEKHYMHTKHTRSLHAVSINTVQRCASHTNTLCTYHTQN